MEKETFDGNDIEVTETETSEQQVSEETEKPHKWRKPLLITLGGIAGTTAAVYIGTAAYFYFHCLPNTEINTPITFIFGVLSISLISFIFCSSLDLF